MSTSTTVIVQYISQEKCTKYFNSNNGQFCYFMRCTLYIRDRSLSWSWNG